MKIVKMILFCAALVLESSVVSAAQQKRSIIPSDCVTVRYLTLENDTQPASLTISPDGKHVAYLVKSPNLVTNQNDIQLYVTELTNKPLATERAILVGNLSRLQWLGDGHYITILAKQNHQSEIRKINVDTAKSETLLRSRNSIDEYVSDATGSVIVFAVAVLPRQIANGTRHEDAAGGYLISFEDASNGWSQRRLFVTRRSQKAWTVPRAIVIESPFSHLRQSIFRDTNGASFMSLSPNGKELLFEYTDTAPNLPGRWLNSPYIKFLKRIKTVPGERVLVLDQLNSGITTVPLETPSITSIPLWSSDGRSFVVFAKPPVGSEWEKHEAEAGPAVLEHAHTADLFWVQPESGRVEMVASHEQAPDPFQPPLKWNEDDSLLVGAWTGVVTRFSHEGGHWVQGESVKIPVNGFSYIASDGEYIIGDRQSATIPPELFIQKLGDAKVSIFQKLNPQFDTLELASVKSVSWATPEGITINGTLFLPPSYKEGNRYPLVIQTKPYYGNSFVCDYGPGHFPSFIPEPLADAGVAYLGISTPDGVQQYYPTGYPGGVKEAAFEADDYDSAVKALSDQGLVDPDKIGIIGFSRSGWYTEFALTHGKTKYRAASVADNVEFSFTQRALSPLIGAVGPSDAMYGGPPSGASLKNWLDYSISFNIDRVHAPLLMEVMGHGALFDRRDSPPMRVTEHFDVFTGLELAHKPVELYYYPDEEHEPDHPIARLANLQRNLDWFRFWLQGYERPNPEDPNQYVRWREMRKQVETNEAKDAAHIP